MSDPTRILVVDDDFATRLLASEALLSDGFSSFEAEDGHDALAQYDRETPDAILLDVNMPGIDGYEVCRRIRQRPGGAAVSILVMTASDDVDAVERAFASGATDFLTKPLNLPLLAHRVRYMLRAAAAVTAAREAASRLARAQRLARLVHWQVTGDQFVWASDPLAVFWPDAPIDEHSASCRVGPPHLLDLVHPDDRDRVAAALATLAGHQIDFRLRLPDGSERSVHQDAELDLGDRGVVLIGATQDVTERKHAEQQIAQLAFYDDLTGIPNRPFVERYLRQADPGPARTAIAIDLGIAHLDHLAVATRDVLIRAAAARVIERVRGADLEIRLDQAPRAIESFAGTTLVARTGADELLVVTTDLLAGSGATTTRQLAEAFAQPFALAGRELVLRPRLGVADYPDPITDLHRLHDHARDALQDAERLAPRNVVVLTASARAQRTRRGQLAHQLAAVLEAAVSEPHPELAIDYVPRVEPRARQLIGVRARPRWLPALHDPQALAQILAGDPVLRDRFARWTLAEACRDAARWTADGATPRLAVELPATVLAPPAFVASFLELAAGCDPRLLDLELADLPSTDDELARIADTLRALRLLGVRAVLARVDDGCTLRELRRLPLDGLRIERHTIDRLGPTLLHTATLLARGLGLQLAVTEIDSPAALAALDPHEPHELAGVLFGLAVPAAAVPGLLADPASLRPRRATIDRPAHAG
jgi:PleD family two-component response regulator/EAL domain-containing protein (putative c-di-GMP-specific phosphodiesterase class I)